MILEHHVRTDGAQVDHCSVSFKNIVVARSAQQVEAVVLARQSDFIVVGIRDVLLGVEADYR